MELSMMAMMRKKWITFALVLIVALAGCTEEKPIEPRRTNPNPGDTSQTSSGDDDEPVNFSWQDEQFYYGEGFSQQLWYDLGSSSVVAQCHQKDWDLAFDCQPGHRRVYLNSGRVMQAAVTDAPNLDAAGDPPPATAFRPDHPNGHPDSLALGARIPTDSVCWIDLGFDGNGRSLGMRKVRFEHLSDGYVLHYAGPGGGNRTTDTVRCDTAFNVMTYSLLDRQARHVAPPKTGYDLWFTAYTHIFYAPGFTPYRVSGVLLNLHQTQAYMDTSIADFFAVEASDFQADRLTEARDAIGYNWKRYSIEEGIYSVYPEQVYFIKNHQGHRYQLRFEAFYNDEGQRGYPGFAFRRLE